MVPSEETARLLADGIAKLGVIVCPGARRNSSSATVSASCAAGEDEWPDLTDAALAETATDWLAPFLAGKTKLSRDQSG